MGDHRLSASVLEHIPKRIFDIPYAADSPSQVLDLWYPDGETDRGYPLVVHFHGGGFRFGGHREDSLEPMLRAVDRGYAVASVEYRKSGEAHFPAMLYDAKAAVRFLKANAGKFKLDAERIALWGPSAGGWLAAMTALTPGNPAFENREMGNADMDSSVQAVIDWCGPCAGFLAMDEAFRQSGTGKAEHDQEDSPESEFMGVGIRKIPELVRLANPCVYVSREMPPFLIMHGTADEVVPVEQSIQFAQAIREAAGEEKVSLYLAKDAPHHGRVWWHEDWVSDLCLDFLDRILGER